MQFSNVPEVRPARRLLIIGSVLFVGLFILNLIATVISFAHDDSDRWLNAMRLLPNLVIGFLIWRGYVQLAMLAERAAVYKHAIEQDLPQLRAAVERTKGASAAGVTAGPTTWAGRSTTSGPPTGSPPASAPAPADAPPEESCEPDSPRSG